MNKKPYRTPAVKSTPRCQFIGEDRDVLGKRCLRDEHGLLGFHVFGPENVRVVVVPGKAPRG